jgi:hypothetical protein
MVVEMCYPAGALSCWNGLYLEGAHWQGTIRQALYLAENSGAQYFQVASDCLSVIKKLQQQGLDRSSTGAIVHDIKLRATKFASCTFKHVYRSCNEAAHVLAKTAEHDQGSCWFNEPPDVIRAIICTEQLFE